MRESYLTNSQMHPGEPFVSKYRSQNDCVMALVGIPCGLLEASCVENLSGSLRACNNSGPDTMISRS